MLTAELNKEKKTKLERAQDFPLRLAMGFQLYHALKGLEEAKETETAEEYELQKELVCALITTLVPALEA